MTVPPGVYDIENLDDDDGAAVDAENHDDDGENDKDGDNDVKLIMLITTQDRS